MSKQNKPDENRRQLLRNIGLGVAAGAIATGVSTSVNASVDTREQKDKQKNTKGYHETKHIRDYYDSL
ncbi:MULTISPECIES: twin-arginine translocation signal domain-containing protein [unclassified Moritella]|uniref:twin-arginine translocation signal domain-containing protein n=1 Tax=unclassified Moritella TaxID=2637987 RepID=UPI001BAD97D5|nr:MULTISPECIES: twin-arginine translocation signal domain-containing protein [unclassified Moritella]QUM86422.1 twin-arginine translocation signal domain-containing protein [Moritella sp. 28]QUM90647.1 twin-arginine translocation signal domain-containing protein [Moritella sp. 36]